MNFPSRFLLLVLGLSVQSLTLPEGWAGTGWVVFEDATGEAMEASTLADPGPRPSRPPWLSPQAWTAIFLNQPLGTLNLGSPNFKETLTLRLEMQPRATMEDAQLQRLIVRPSLAMQVRPDLEVSVGAFGILDDQWNLAEVRSWQQLQKQAPIGGVILVNRARLEQRMTAQGERDVGHRLRQMIQAQIPLNQEKNWLILLTDEVFLNFTDFGPWEKGGFDQNRASVLLRRKTPSGSLVDFGAMFHHLETPEGRRNRINLQLNLTLNRKRPTLRRQP